MRRQQEQKILQRTIPGSDRVDRKDKPSITKDDFEAVLKKVSRKIDSKEK